MTLTNATDFITQLSAQYLLCTSASAHTTWYPSAPSGATAPFAVLESTQRRMKYAEGARGLPQNEFAIAITAALTVGQMESLAEDIIRELSEQFTGLPFNDLSYELSSDLGPEEIAGGATTRCVVISGTAGLNP